MSKEEDEENKLKIIWIDGIACMKIPPNTIMKKRQSKSVIQPFRFGYMQEHRKKDLIPEVIKELDKIFETGLNTPFFPANWKIYEINQWGEIKELKDEDKEDDNGK